jgi:hypothetical protein
LQLTHDPDCTYALQSRVAAAEVHETGAILHAASAKRWRRKVGQTHSKENEMNKMNMFRAAICAGALSVPMVATTAAQGPVVTGGLVNITVVDVIDDVVVNVEDVNVALGVALQLAANVCDVGVNVLAAQLHSGTATCTATTGDITRTATITR